jgi:DNA segregation ATPase FtsK/SpoIIIE, S-DNA-T family
VKDDLGQVRDVLRRVHRLMVDRQGAIAQVLGVPDAWHLEPSPSWPLVVVVVDEAHSFFHERKGTSAEVEAHNALVAELSRLVEELVRKGRNVAIQVMLLTQRATGDAIPTRIRDNCQSPSASPPAPWTGRWPPWARRSASTPTPPRCC